MRKVIFLLLLSIVFISCKTKYIPVETIITKTEYKSHTDTLTLTDTIHNTKETIIREANAGDSLLLAKMGLKLQENQKLLLVLQRELEKEKSSQSEHRIDTILKTDTIKAPYPIEKKLTKWESAKMVIGGISLYLCGAAILLLILGFIFRGKFK